ncbi:AI-2E family transporter [Kineobactrum salinum]|uniref:AI-2E family transporter n=1 Tax=Kineobactrum salinum TaxID=2708301 RepID=A0A6C0U475_9GAMM|nr:AI-2E family transporter [Kineobactrum salinum]QIB66643.1 AI-2E family transporter [Kineobactrum salinum]
MALALLYTIYFAKSLLMPIVVALLFALLLSPLVNLFKRFYIPRTVSALLMLCLIGGPLALLASQLSVPAQRWIEEIPELTAQLSEQVDDLTDKLAPAPEPVAEPPEPRGFSFFGLFGGDDRAAEDDPEVEGKDEDSDRVSESLKQGDWRRCFRC